MSAAWPHNRTDGYALLVMLAILAVGSLFGIVGALDRNRMQSRQTEATQRALGLAREALMLYAVTYRDYPERAAEVSGYLPCPDTLGNGTEQPPCSAGGQAAIGLLPHKTLGLPDLRDADGNCLWYAVSGNFKNSPKTIPMNWDTQGQFSVASGGTILTAPDDANGGAAAVVFAPGPALTGQTRSITHQPCGVDPAQVSAYLESSAGSFVQGPLRDAVGTVIDNDRLAWITPRDIFSRIVARADFKNPLGTYPEGRISRLIEASRQALEGKLWSDMAAQTGVTTGSPSASAPTLSSDYVQYSGKRIGELPELKPLAYGGASYDNDFDNWRDQFRYVVCDNLKATDGCLVFGAQACRGALLFGGQASASAFPFGGPRPSSQKPRSPSRSPSLANYFEAGGALALLDSSAMGFLGPSSYTDSARDADVGICLAPGAYATFAKDIAGFTRVVSTPTRPEAVINTGSAGISLGNLAATVAGSGCAWLPTPLPFNTSLRAYFTLRIADLGEGMVFVIADGAHNQAAMTNGTACGSTTGSQLGYSGTGIAPPKIGLEIDTRQQSTGNCTGNNRNDPGANHLAFVYWGSAASNTDDNCHNAGTLGSGSEPLNPRSLTAASAMLQSAAWSGSIVTASTAAAHGLASGQQVAIDGATPSGYDGSFAVSVIDATHFAYALAGDPGPYAGGGSLTTVAGIKNVQSSDPHLPYAGTLPLNTDIHVRLDVAKTFDAALIRSATWSAPANKVTVATFTPHGLQSNQRVTLAGILPATYNGTYAITVTDATHFTFDAGANPGDYVSGGRIIAPPGIAVQTATWASHAVAITTTIPHGLVSGQPVSIAGIAPAGYNGTHRIVVDGPTRFIYALGADPGPYASGGSLMPAVALTLKAYVASELGVFGASYLSTCTAADLRNLSADLETICTQRTSIEQNSIPIDVDAASGRTLATIYAGFTNAQSAGAAGVQSITISNFAIRTQ